MSSPDTEAIRLLHEFSNGFMVSQVGMQGGHPLGDGIHGGELGLGHGDCPLPGEGCLWGPENVLE